MAYQLRVRRGCSVLSPKDSFGMYRVFKAGELIPEGLFPQATIKEHLASGYCEPVNVGTPPEQDIPTDNVPGVQPAPIIPSGTRDTSPSAPVELVTTAPGGVTSSVQIKKDPVPEVKTPLSIWNLDPEQLKGKSLDELNVMILERDDTIDPFDTLEEAVAQLSQDFNG